MERREAVTADKSAFDAGGRPSDAEGQTRPERGGAENAVVAERQAHEPRRLFPFVGESLALDLVNTEVVIRGKRRDLLQAPADLDAWWRAARGRHPLPVIVPTPGQAAADGETTLDAATSLRVALRRLFDALTEDRAIDPADLDALNRVLGTGRRAVECTPDGALRPIYRAGDAAADGMLLAVALSALELVTARDRRRLHRCGNGRCVLFFYDTTKSATRRWCSTGCMNRARSLARWEQRKTGARR
jgi:predicted RNA-binding Zn ribbon-like protein